VGNHEVVADPKIGAFSGRAVLKKFGVTPEKTSSTTRCQGARVIYCGAGNTLPVALTIGPLTAKYAETDAQLQKGWTGSTAQAFVPAFMSSTILVFARSGLGPIPAPDNSAQGDAFVWQRKWRWRVENGHVTPPEIY